jgi:hypothetical protein
LELSKLSDLHLFLDGTMTMVHERIDDASNCENTCKSVDGQRLAIYDFRLSYHYAELQVMANLQQ